MGAIVAPLFRHPYCSFGGCSLSLCLALVVAPFPPSYLLLFLPPLLLLQAVVLAFVHLWLTPQPSIHFIGKLFFEIFQAINQLCCAFFESRWLLLLLSTVNYCTTYYLELWFMAEVIFFVGTLHSCVVSLL